jgi:hypothetical protein
VRDQLACGFVDEREVRTSSIGHELGPVSRVDFWPVLSQQSPGPLDVSAQLEQSSLEHRASGESLDPPLNVVEITAKACPRVPFRELDL